MRVYALRRSLLLGSATFILSIAPTVVGFVVFGYGLTGRNVFPVGCTSLDNEPTDLVKKSVL
ncbi:hypothetical protein BD309DRAFT_822202, partial [Dichomitus squalens]